MQSSELPTFIWGSGTSSIMYVGERALAFSWKSESSQPASFAKVDGMDLIRKGRLRGSGEYHDFLYRMKGEIRVDLKMRPADGACHGNP